MTDTARVRVHVDTNTCVGSGTCAMVDPEHFDLVDGKARPAEGAVELTEDLSDALLDCPVRAITAAEA